MPSLLAARRPSSTGLASPARVALATALALALTLLATASPARAEALAPARTWAVVAGVLEWKDRALAPFSKVHRKDKELYDQLGQMGVPVDQRRLLLDRDAQTDAILDALRDAVRRAPRGSTLIFYFAGHGLRDPDGRIVFASSDVSVDRATKTGLVLDDLVPILAAFKGDRLVLMADCCHSGGLVAVGDALVKAGLRVAVLTSAEASNTSTGNWTFTQTVIDGLRGRWIGDLDGDGAVTLGEVAREVADAMKFREQQRSAWSARGVSPGLELARAAEDPERLAPGAGALARRAWVVVPRDGQDEVARVLGVGDGGRLRVAFYDYSDEVDAWAAARDAKPIAFRTWPVGTTLTVDWEGQPYEAKVTAVDGGFMRITYPGWSPVWDEWVTAERVKAGPGLGEGPKPAERVSVEWQGTWYDAVVTGHEGKRTCIHYVGWAASWDECVPAARLRAR